MLMKRIIVVFFLVFPIQAYISCIKQKIDVDSTGLYEIIKYSCPMPNDTKQYVYKFSDVYLYKEGRVITEDGTWLVTSYAPGNERLPFAIPAVVEFREIAGVVALFATVYQHSWYHWLLEALPRLYILQQSGLQYDYLYVYNGGMTEIQKQSLHAVLDYLGIVQNKIIFANETVCLHVERVIAPSYPMICNRGGVWPLWVRDFLQAVFLQDRDQSVCKTGSRIYISRADATTRRVSNEAELVTLLERYGFEKVLFSALTLYEQAAICHNAEVIVGPHGAGLSNIVFCRPGTKFLEIDYRGFSSGFSSHRICRPFFIRIGHDFKLVYRKFEVGQEILDVCHINDDMHVDLAAFEECLNALLESQ